MTSGSTLRRDQASAVRERILAAALGVIEDGEDPNMRSVAQAAQISERTIYRYFASREELYAALMPQLRARASTPMADDVSGLPDYIRTLYTTFDHNARLAHALTTARFHPRTKMRSENLRALRRIIDAAFPKAPAADRESAAASLRIPLSAAGWAYLADCDMDLESSVSHVQWLTRVVLERLAALQGDRHARR